MQFQNIFLSSAVSYDDYEWRVRKCVNWDVLSPFQCTITAYE
jgi:hypothetical protein